MPSHFGTKGLLVFTPSSCKNIFPLAIRVCKGNVTPFIIVTIAIAVIVGFKIGLECLSPNDYRIHHCNNTSESYHEWIMSWLSFGYQRVLEISIMTPVWRKLANNHEYQLNWHPLRAPLGLRSTHACASPGFYNQISSGHPNLIDYILASTRRAKDVFLLHPTRPQPPNSADHSHFRALLSRCEPSQCRDFPEQASKLRFCGFRGAQREFWGWHVLRSVMQLKRAAPVSFQIVVNRSSINKSTAALCMEVFHERTAADLQMCGTHESTAATHLHMTLRLR